MVLYLRVAVWYTCLTIVQSPTVDPENLDHLVQLPIFRFAGILSQFAWFLLQACFSSVMVRWSYLNKGNIDNPVLHNLRG